MRKRLIYVLGLDVAVLDGAAAVSAVNNTGYGMRSLNIVTTLVTFALCGTAFADPADKRVGIGLGVGVATGPNVQVMTSNVTHLDLGMGLYYNDHIRLQADHDWRFVNLASRRSVSVPIYMGFGAFATDHAWGQDGGLRAPLGIQADFARAPIQLFGELAPELAVVQVVDT